MGFFQLVSVRLTLGLVFGIILGFYLEIPPKPFFIVFCVLLILLGLNIRKRRGRVFSIFAIVVVLGTISLGIMVVGFTHPKNQAQGYLGQEITSYHTFRARISEPLKHTGFSYRYLAEIIQIDQNPARGTIVVNISRETIPKRLYVDDEFVAYGKLNTINPPLNPHQFDYRDYLRKQGIFHELRIGSGQLVQFERQTTTVYGLAQNLRQKIISKLKQHDFGSDEVSVMQALLLGERSELSGETYDNYKNAGAVHILAISGLHIGILLLLLQLLLTPLESLPHGKTLKLVTILVCLWGFAFVAGLSPSIVRAVTMFSFVAYAMQLNRPTNTFNTIVWSMFFILLFKPLFLFQVGFQMSYAAVFAIVWLYPKLQRFWEPKGFLPKRVWQLVSVSVAAQLGVLPLSLFHFHQFPALFFISNLVVVPFLGVILGGGMLVIALALLNALPPILVTGYNTIIKGMNTIIGFVAQQETFLFTNISFDVVQMLLAYVIIFALVFTLTRPKFKNIMALGSSVILFQVWVIVQTTRHKEKESLLVAHQTKNSMILHHKGDVVVIYSATGKEAKNRIVTDYVVGERIDSVSSLLMQNSYHLGNKMLYVMDSLGVYPKQTDYLLITQSPRINLERLIDSLKPVQIIADGSNYNGHVARWRQTCLKRKIPFHHTGEKGAYFYDLTKN
ncbi:ComEC/Rec2 family competence protein [Allomuricauda sp. SCSIO 65647]|uniref:ComEC/Rec2 family competence protein n=1 Tax=Allomuricauda sp. SCSIO 65647 TaxID=2908843 RepID=UPI001F389314|nr:ComEC/Rec2 family competence protein [Muricauda sp. SCSIO 65647]UJH66305.1 ComEC family competence protein [Muricauda sp. SCSIO 65647]